MNINSIDLNLFLVFQAIYATRSVTLAGDRLGMTQSAVSNALKRMRERFNDALFVRSADGMVPTPVAERLIAPIEEGIACLVQAVDQGRTFEAETSSRIFRIAVNDIGQLVMMPELLSVARGIAPGVRFETVDVSMADARQRMLHGQVDIALGSWESMGPSFYQQRLFDETFVVLMSKTSPLGTRERIELDDYLAAEHIAYRPQGTTDSQLQQTLERAGALDRRRVVLTAAHSLGLSSIVATSGLLLTAPARLAKAMVASRADLRSVEAPFDVTPFEIRQQWHERFHQDSGNRWLRELIFGLFHERSSRELVPPQARHR
ncbi:LysR family transcriptional regulator [Variovorax paradoxus]|uniref:LysR family transcriptional regulator n=1 Tax=Variovorax paradoxus TaxID=34073 RepID=UPI0024805F26|nr:LysR family transcriptional regulator [Variovorax paradoxus]WGT62343.1 LysR family transcriptional regulator [Variovorax paradoxus]